MTTEQTARLIIGSIVVILAAYYILYFVGTRRNARVRGRQINVRERFALSKDKTICLMEVGDKVYLVVVTNNGATLLDTFELSEFDEFSRSIAINYQPGMSPENYYTGPFPGLFNKLRARFSKNTAPGEDFAETLRRSSDEDDYRSGKGGGQ